MPNIKHIRLTGPCTVATIGACRNAMLRAFKGEHPITLDLSGVTTADVTLPQLVLSAKRAAGRRKMPLAIGACSEAALASFVRAGVNTAAIMAPSPSAET